jgi:hypothetical protein
MLNVVCAVSSIIYSHCCFLFIAISKVTIKNFYPHSNPRKLGHQIEVYIIGTVEKKVPLTYLINALLLLYLRKLLLRYIIKVADAVGIKVASDLSLVIHPSTQLWDKQYH